MAIFFPSFASCGSSYASFRLREFCLAALHSSFVSALLLLVVPLAEEKEDEDEQ